MKIFLWFQKQPPEVFYKKAVLKHFTILKKTYMSESLANKKSAESPTQVFHCNFENFLRTTISKNICQRLLLWFETCIRVYHDLIFVVYFTLFHNKQNSDNKSSSSRDSLFYSLWCHHSPATEKSFKLVELFFSRANEVKTRGLVQQLILRIRRDLIFRWLEIRFKLRK